MAEVRLIDANAAARNTDKEIYWTESEAAAVRNFLAHQPTIDPESLRPKGRWDWKHRHKGGFHKYTGVDEYGETQTITVDERFECDEPYCPNCGKWNESTYLNFCPNCGAQMTGGG